MDLQLNGKIKLVGDTQTFDSGFQKREFVVTTQEQYPQDVKFEFLKEKTDILDAYKVGDNVNVFFNIRGNEYNAKYYVNLQAWKMDALAGEAPKVGKTTPPPVVPPAITVGDDDDLPF